MKWFEVELEIPIYGKSFEIIQAMDQCTAEKIAIRKTTNQYNLTGVDIFITKVKKLKT